MAHAATPLRIVFLGDSLTEGYGVPKEATFPALIAKQLKSEGKNVEVIDAGIGGSTSASAVARLKWQLRQKPDLLVLALGANDGLRGLETTLLEKNLDAALALAKENQVKTLLVGMKVPPNYGADYSKRFEAIFPRLAKKYSVPLMPFLLDGVAGDPKLNQADGIHPTGRGYQIVAEKLLPFLRALL